MRHEARPDDPSRGEPRTSSDDDLLRAQVRRRLAAELHDIVTHHLANVALRTMGELDLVDVRGLRAILGEVNGAAGSALVELRLLAQVLADDPEAATEVGALRGLSRDVTPSAAAAAWARRLDRAGLVAAYAVPETADHLALSVQSTISRTFEATAEAALLHAAVGSRCATTVTVEPTRVLVRSATTPPPDGLSADEPGHELRRLRERVDLTCGRFGAGVLAVPPGPPQWVVTVVVPLD